MHWKIIVFLLISIGNSAPGLGRTEKVEHPSFLLEEQTKLKKNVFPQKSHLSEESSQEKRYYFPVSQSSLNQKNFQDWEEDVLHKKDLRVLWLLNFYEQYYGQEEHEKKLENLFARYQDQGTLNPQIESWIINHAAKLPHTALFLWDRMDKKNESYNNLTTQILKAADHHTASPAALYNGWHVYHLNPQADLNLKKSTSLTWLKKAAEKGYHKALVPLYHHAHENITWQNILWCGFNLACEMLIG